MVFLSPSMRLDRDLTFFEQGWSLLAGATTTKNQISFVGISGWEEFWSIGCECVAFYLQKGGATENV